MSWKRILLLSINIGIILASYTLAFNSIRNHYKPADTKKHFPSKYSGNQLPNGTSPFNSCFGSNTHLGNAALTIKNGANSDAIVCLLSVSHGRTIRNVYVQRKTSYKIENISQGRYKIRVFYGNDWNPELENPCGSKGYFESNTYFSEFDETQYFEDNHTGYTIATITLHTVKGGNVSTSRINKADFFKN